MGQPVMVLMPPSRLGELAILHHLLQNNQPVPRVETEVMRCDGSLVSVARTITPWRDEFNSFAGGVALLTDMTPRKQFEQKLRERRQQLRELSARLERVKEEELLRISRELHDELGQQLTGLRLDLAWLEEKLGDVRPELADRLESMARLVDDTLKQVRRISSEMRPPLLDELGLPSAIEHWAEQLQARSNLTVTLNLQANLSNLRSESSLAIYRILQEASTNVLRHAEAKHLWVEALDHDEDLVIVVRDDGRGFEPPSARVRTEPGAGLGLLGMRERAHLWGGDLRLHSSCDQGSKVELRLPRMRISRETEIA
jgi:signal transduction histidine kinase